MLLPSAVAVIDLSPYITATRLSLDPYFRGPGTINLRAEKRTISLNE